MLTSPTLALFAFAGTGNTPEESATDAERLVNVFLATHQWRDTDGRSVYASSTMIAPGSDGRFHVVITLIGPSQET